MGRACARSFGETLDLVLTDVAGPALERVADELRSDGFTIISALSGQIGSDELIVRLVNDLAGDLPLTIIHTAGISPSLAAARDIMAVNLIATVKLIDAIEPILRPGSVAMIIASTAGHLMPDVPETSALLANPLTSDFLDRIMAVIAGMAQGKPEAERGISYSLSKQAIIRLVEQRCISWGHRGARITSISPGMILTPLGRKEIAATSGAAEMQNAAPLGRAGIATDIARVARFLASDDASYVTGCNLRVDGGAVPALRLPFAGRAAGGPTPQN